MSNSKFATVEMFIWAGSGILKIEFFYLNTDYAFCNQVLNRFDKIFI